MNSYDIIPPEKDSRLRRTPEYKTAPDGKQYFTIEYVPREAEGTLLQDDLMRIRHCKNGLFAYLRRDAIIGFSMDVFGEWAADELTLLDQIIGPGDIVLDVGANIGTHTVAFAKKVGRTGRVVSFEPQRLTSQLLNTNIILNHCYSVSVDRRYVGEVCTAATNAVVDVIPEADFNYGSLPKGGFLEDDRFNRDYVAQVTIDQAVVEHNLTRCRLIKIDTEGMEGKVIAGATETLSRFKPVVYSEIGSDESLKEVEQWLLPHGYDLYWHFYDCFGVNAELSREFGLPTYIDRQLLCVQQGSIVNNLMRHEVGQGMHDSFERFKKLIMDGTLAGGSNAGT